MFPKHVVEGSSPFLPVHLAGFSNQGLSRGENPNLLHPCPLTGQWEVWNQCPCKAQGTRHKAQGTRQALLFCFSFCIG